MEKKKKEKPFITKKKLSPFDHMVLRRSVLRAASAVCEFVFCERCSIRISVPATYSAFFGCVCVFDFYFYFLKIHIHTVSALRACVGVANHESILCAAAHPPQSIRCSIFPTKLVHFNQWQLPVVQTQLWSYCISVLCCVSLFFFFFFIG